MFTKEDFAKLRSLAAIERISPRDFEWFTKFFLESMGCSNVLVTKKHGPHHADGGIDVTCKRNGQECIVQCKKWRFGFGGLHGPMPVRVVRELGGCMLRDGVRHGILVSTLTYDHLTQSEAQKMNIELIGLPDIFAVMREHNPKFSERERLSWFQALLRALWSFLRMIVRG